MTWAWPRADLWPVQRPLGRCGETLQLLPSEPPAWRQVDVCHLHQTLDLHVSSKAVAG